MERTQPTAAPDDASEPDLAPWPSYDPGNFYDELVGPRGVPRPAAETLWRHFTALGPEALAERQMAADHEMRAIGVTFTVYEGSAGVDRPWPFDIMPRMMPSDQWQTVESGLVRWKQVAAELAGLGSSGLLARRTKLARLLRNEGATYNVTQDNQSRRQPWLLDPCPLVVDESEWAALESGVAQRVTLLDLILADIYANRRLVAEGLIPAELVLGHPPFPRPCVGMGAPGDHRLFLTAMDVVRDGRPLPGHRR